MNVSMPHMSPVLIPQRVDRRILRRISTAFFITLLFHLLFFLGIAPYLHFYSQKPSQVEVLQISPKQLAVLKEKMIKNKFLDPLLQQELHEQFRTKERPKEAHFMGAFNQTVPKQQIAGPQQDEPLAGGGGKKGSKTKSLKKTMQEPLKLSEIGLGSKLSKPKVENIADEQGPQGQTGPHRPVGRLDTKIEQGNENLLNAVENEYYSFFARFEEPIIRNWFFLIRSHEVAIYQELVNKKIQVGTDLPTTIKVMLDRDGIITAEVVESCGIPTLDWAAKEAVMKIHSFPNPPPGLFDGQSSFTHHLRFMVSINGSPLIQSTPGLRWY